MRKHARVSGRISHGRTAAKQRLIDLPEVLTVSEVQEYLHVGRGLAYELARAHGIRLGRLVRVPRAAIEKILAR